MEYSCVFPCSSIVGCAVCYRKQGPAGVGEFLYRGDELVGVGLLERDRQRHHAALGEPDAARPQVEIKEIEQAGMTLCGIRRRADRDPGNVYPDHRADAGELYR